MSQQQFDEIFAGVMSSLGDPTRRAIYLSVRVSGEAKSVAEVAEAFEVHPNVARYHLEHLAEAGYLKVERASPGSRGGRPAHLFVATEQEVHLDLPAQSFELLAALLTQMLLRVDEVDVAELAYEVGFSHGRELATALDLSNDADLAATMKAAAAMMEELGFRTAISSEDSECAYQTTHCPFGKVALENPTIVCALDRGLVTGMMRASNEPVEVTVMPHTRIAGPCTTLVTIPT